MTPIRFTIRSHISYRTSSPTTPGPSTSSSPPTSSPLGPFGVASSPRRSLGSSAQRVAMELGEAPPPPTPTRREERAGDRRPSTQVGEVGRRAAPKAPEKPSAEATRVWYLLQEKKAKALADWLNYGEGQRAARSSNRASGAVVAMSGRSWG